MERARTCGSGKPITTGVSILLSLLVSGRAAATLPEVGFLGTVNSKDPDTGTIAIQVESFQWFGGGWEPLSSVLEAPAPNEDALAEVNVGDRVEAAAFGYEDYVYLAWRAIGKLNSEAEPRLTDIYGDFCLWTPWAEGPRFGCGLEVDCPNCRLCADRPYICPAAACRVSFALSAETYRLLPGESTSYENGGHCVEVRFHAGETWGSACGPMSECVGGMIRSNYTVRLREVGQPKFTRGEANGEGTLDISDPVATLRYLFLGTENLPCLDAADSNDSGAVDLSDAIYTLTFLFLGGSAPPAPFGGCGVDGTGDDLDCVTFPVCS